MKAFAAVFRREVVDKRNIFFATAVVATLPFILPILRLTPRGSWSDTRSMLAFVLMVLFGEGIAIALGFTMFGTDLASGRISFYYSRPITPLALWMGKLTAALVTVVVAAGMIVVPVWLTGDFKTPQGWALKIPSGDSLAAFILSVLFAILLCNALSIIRSRSAWMALDLVCAGVAAFVLWTAVRPLALAGAETGVLRILKASLLMLFAALFAGGLSQVTFGRTDRRRSHAALSIPLWAIALLTAGAASAYSWWYQHPAFQDLTAGHGVAQTSGDWVAITGPARGRPMFFGQGFLVNLESGRTVALGAAGSPPVLSRNGAAAAGVSGEGNVWYADLKLGRITTMAGVTSARFAPLVLSDDGSRLAMIHNQSLSVYSVPDGRLLAAAAVSPTRGMDKMFFRDPGHVRVMSRLLDTSRQVVTGSGSGMEVIDLDVAGHRLNRHPLSIPESHAAFTDRSGERLLVGVTRDRQPNVLLMDTASGATLGSFPGRWATFIDDETFAMIEETGGQTSIHLFDRDGRSTGIVPLPTGGSLQAVRVTGVTARGNLLISEVENATSRPVIVVVNPGNGSVLRTIKGVRRAGNPFMRSDPRPIRLAAKPLFMDDAGGLEAIDPETGIRQRVVTGNPKEAEDQ